MSKVRERNLKVAVAVIGLIGSVFSPLVPFIVPISNVIKAFSEEVEEGRPQEMDVPESDMDTTNEELVIE